MDNLSVTGPGIQPSEGENDVEGIGSRTSTPASLALTINPGQPSKKQKTDKPEGNRRAAIWDHYIFSSVEGMDGKLEPLATCKYCKKTKYKALSGYGTSNATKHLDKCDAYKSFIAENPLCGTDFDQKVFCKMFAEAIMYHAYPLSIVEHVKTREMLTYLNPKVRHITRNTVLRYCSLEHNKLKTILFDSLADVSSRICFTCDLWSACTTRGFLTLTAHFIDENWSLKSSILNFRYFPPPHRGVDIYLFVLGLIKDWKLEGKIFSMTCDNASSMDVMISQLKTELNYCGALPLGGRFFHVRCCAHILNLIVQSGMKIIDESVLKLRQAVNYITASNSRLVCFEKCLVDVKSTFVGKKLRLDCPTRWNSTYLMLKTALEAKEGLNLFGVVDKSFDYSLTYEEWDIIDFVCKFLEPFYAITVMFSGSNYPTANLYFTNILAVEMLLVVGHSHVVSSIRAMSTAMMEKFEKYWSEYSVVLAIALILDPRYKMSLVKAALAKLYVPSEVEEKVQVIYDALIDLYKFYDETTASAPTTNSYHSSAAQFSMSSIFEDFEATNASGGNFEAGMNAYLNSPLMPRTSNFDILKYWQSQMSIFPIISRMAKDILAIPITSVASESSFSMGGRVLTKYRSCLRTDNVEAFVTTQNWLYGYLKEEEVKECFEVMKEILPDDIDFDSLPTED